MARQDKIGKHKTSVFHTMIDDEICLVVRYHDTNVVVVAPTKIVLDTGGWFTPTTKLRMNQTSRQYDLGYQVYQRRGEWFVDWKGETLVFSDDAVELPYNT